MKNCSGRVENQWSLAGVAFFILKDSVRRGPASRLLALHDRRLCAAPAALPYVSEVVLDDVLHEPALNDHDGFRVLELAEVEDGEGRHALDDGLEVEPALLREEGGLLLVDREMGELSVLVD